MSTQEANLHDRQVSSRSMSRVLDIERASSMSPPDYAGESDSDSEPSVDVSSWLASRSDDLVSRVLQDAPRGPSYLDSLLCSSDAGPGDGDGNHSSLDDELRARHLRLLGRRLEREVGRHPKAGAAIMALQRAAPPALWNRAFPTSDTFGHAPCSLMLAPQGAQQTATYSWSLTPRGAHSPPPPMSRSIVRLLARVVSLLLITAAFCVLITWTYRHHHHKGGEAALSQEFLRRYPQQPKLPPQDLFRLTATDHVPFASHNGARYCDEGEYVEFNECVIAPQIFDQPFLVRRPEYTPVGPVRYFVTKKVAQQLANHGPSHPLVAEVEGVVMRHAAEALGRACSADLQLLEETMGEDAAIAQPEPVTCRDYVRFLEHISWHHRPNSKKEE